MSDSDNKPTFKFSDERFKYIGFDVFPGKAGDIFKTENERKTLIEKVMTKFRRSEGEVRDRCTLMEARVTSFEKGFLTLAVLVLAVSLFLPWFSGSYEIVTERVVPLEQVYGVTESGEASKAQQAAEAEERTGPQPAISPEATESIEGSAAPAETATPTGMTTITEVTYDRRSLTGLGTALGLGSYLGMIFQSGAVLMVSGILMLLFFLCCLGFIVFNLYILYGSGKLKEDEYALRLKKMLRYNWIPVLIWLTMLALSFIGSTYGFETTGAVDQIGEAYSIATFIGLLSVGVYLSLGVFIVMALKAKEI